jgi:hypothetical protein
MKPSLIANITALPTWGLTRALRPILPDDHPWRHRKFSLSDWAMHRTEFTKAFDLVLWLNILMVILIFKILWR